MVDGDGGKTRRMVLALGGNAIAAGGIDANITTQFAQSRITAVHIADLICAGHHVLLTHGNGPQVGMALRRVELSRHEVYPLDLGLCVANTQALMGYMFGQCIRNEMAGRQRQLDTCTIITTVVVDQHDPAFDRPTKPIGSYLSSEAARQRIEEDGWQVVEVPGKGLRRVVPSPRPQRIVEEELIAHLFDEGRMVICCGGGIPVYHEGHRDEGLEAVIDKDLTAALLAVTVKADTLMILTDVDQVALDYGTPQQQPIDRMTISAARRYWQAGQFAPGSMGPKVEACFRFMELTPVPHAEALITSVERCDTALAGLTGTRIVRDDA